MAGNADVLSDAANIIRSRISELKGEVKNLERALANLTGGREGRRGPGRPRGSTSTPKRRRRRGGTRADQAVKLIKANPGIGASEVAKRMGIKPNYLYRVLADLEKEGRVKKSGRKYTAV